jgi:hypothetical protein
MVEPLEGRALLTTLYVDIANASGPQDGTQAHPYRSIQAAIDSSAPSGDTIKVAAGTYQEALEVNHSVTLLGPNAGINPNTAPRNAEAVIEPPLSNPDAGRIVHVTANNVTIDGLLIDGNNSSLPTGTLLNGVSSNAASGITNVDSAGNLSVISGLVVENDIIRNLTAFGVMADVNDFSSSMHNISTGNVITRNLIENIPTVSPVPGRGISIEDDFFADVTDNVIKQAGTGIQVIFMVDPDPTGHVSQISNNQVWDYNLGIYLWTIDTDTPSYAVTENSVWAEDDPQTTATNVGIEFDRVLSSSVEVRANGVTGTHTGMEFQYTPNTPSITVTGATLKDNAYGIVLTNSDALTSNDPNRPIPPRPMQVNLQAVTIEDPSIAGIAINDALGTTGSTVTLNADAGSVISGAPHGVLLSGPGAHLVDAGIPSVTFTANPPAETNLTSAEFTFTGYDKLTSAGDLTYTYSLDGGQARTTSGSVSLSDLELGGHTLVVQATDQAGNVGSATYQWTVIPRPTPDAPSTPAFAPGDDTAWSDDGITSDNVPTFVGTAPAGNTVTLYAGTTEIGTAAASSTGSWSFTVGGAGSLIAAFADGSYAITATDTDASGTTSAASAALNIVIDTARPIVSFTSTPPPQSTSNAASFTFTATDNVTASGTLGLSYSVDGLKEQGTFGTVNLSHLAPGAHTIVAHATDQAGNVGSATYQWTIIAPPPPAPSTPALAAGSDSANPADDITNVTTPTITGTAPAGNTVTIYSGHTSVIGTVTAQSDGTWSFTVGGTGSVLDSLGDGSYAITATDTDANGSTSTFSDPLTVLVVTARPTVSFTATPPAQTTSTAASFTFSGMVRIQAAGPVSLAYSVDGSSFTATDGSVDLSGLGLGAHTIVVQATDLAGNVGSASYDWTIIPQAPPAAPSTPALAPGSDSANPSDGVTNVNVPTFVGNAPAGNTVNLYAGTTLLGTTTAQSDGSWSFTVGSVGSAVDSLTDGAYNITATDTDSNSNTSAASSALTIVIDTTRPTVNFTATPAGQTTDTAASFDFTGSDDATAAADLSLMYSLDGGAFTAASSPLSLTVSLGAHTLVVQAADQAGNVGSASYQWTVTSPAPPAAPSTPALADGSDSGNASDGVTNVNVPTFVGNAPAGNTVTLYAGTTRLGATTARSDGSWSFTVGGVGSLLNKLADGSYAITATDTDSNGNTSASSSPLAIVVDTARPTVNFTATPPAETTDTAASFRFGANDDATAAANLSFAYSLDGGALTTASSPLNLTVGLGAHTLVLQATDQAGNVGSATYQWTVTAPVSTPPAAPSQPALAGGSDTGVSASDGITNDPTPTFVGNAPAGSKVTLYAGTTVLGSTTASGSGSWSFTVGNGAPIPALPDGSYAITATATDSSGKTSQASPALQIVVDTTAPVIVTSLTPQPNNAGWYNTSVTARYIAADALSGLASPRLGSFTFNSDGAWQTHLFAVSDIAGNIGTATVGPVHIDRAAPFATIAANPTLLQPGVVLLTVTGQVADMLSGPGATASYAIRDSSGRISVGGMVNVSPSGAYSFALALPASRAGKHPRSYTIALTALDAAGNTRTVHTTVVVPSKRTVIKAQSPRHPRPQVRHPKGPAQHARRMPRR